MSTRSAPHATSQDTEVIVFGSQAILGQYPDPPGALRYSMEVDLTPKNYPERVDRIDGVLGELSQFHATHGFYVHGVPIEAAVLPPGWEARAWRLQNRGTRQYTGWCVEANDLAVSKLVAFREKDRDFVRILLAEGMADPATLIERIHALVGGNRVADSARLIRWIEVTIAD